MTDFAEVGRQRCRRKGCQKKLSVPTTNDHHAFCRPWCHEAFYGAKCLVCEKPLPPNSRSDRKLCKRPKCRYSYSQNRAFFDFPAQDSPNCSELHKTPAKEGFLGGQKRDRASPGWRVIAGRPPTASQLHCATVPDGPDRKWTDGRLERIEAQNRRSLEQHFDALDKAAVDSDFCNVCGREDDLADYRTAKGWATTCHGCRAASATKENPAVKALIATIPDDLSIPKFLQRAA
jgi:hypothetical protein